MSGIDGAIGEDLTLNEIREIRDASADLKNREGINLDYQLRDFFANRKAEGFGRAIYINFCETVEKALRTLELFNYDSEEERERYDSELVEKYRSEW